MEDLWKMTIKNWFEFDQGIFLFGCGVASIAKGQNWKFLRNGKSKIKWKHQKKYDILVRYINDSSSHIKFLINPQIKLFK